MKTAVEIAADVVRLGDKPDVVAVLINGQWNVFPAVGGEEAATAVVGLQAVAISAAELALKEGQVQGMQVIAKAVLDAIYAHQPSE